MRTFRSQTCATCGQRPARRELEGHAYHQEFERALYFNPEEYSTLHANEPRRDFLAKVGVNTSIIEKMMSIDSEHAFSLSPADVDGLRVAPDWQEMKLTRCAKSDIEMPPDIKPDDAKWLAQMQRHICWSHEQQELRRPLIEDYLEPK